MELLDSARLDPNERLIARRPLRIGGMRLDCSHTAEVSELDADDAIAYSSNSYVAKVALRMSGDALTEALRRRGLDSLTGLLQSESTGHIERPTNQEQLQLMALGARGIEVRPLQLLAAYRKLALTRRSRDRKSTRLNSSHTVISYAVFCLKKKKTNTNSKSMQQ